MAYGNIPEQKDEVVTRRKAEGLLDKYNDHNVMIMNEVMRKKITLLSVPNKNRNYSCHAYKTKATGVEYFTHRGIQRTDLPY